MSQKSKKAEPAFSFEAAMDELENIVAALESEDQSLQQVIASYERGNQLLKVCDQTLKQARLRMETLTWREEDENVLVNSATTCQARPSVSLESDDDDDTIRLF